MGSQNQNMDWDALGDQIERIIDQAVNSRDYQKLNQTIRQTVSRAVDTGSETIRKVKASTSQSMPKAPGARSESSRYQKVHEATVEPNLPVLYSNVTTQKARGILKTVGGGVLTGLSSMGLLAYGIVDAVILHSGFLSVVSMAGIAMLTGGCVLLGKGIGAISRTKRFEKYKKLLGNKTYCEVKRLASGVGLPVKKVRRDLKGMINDGWFLEGHLDDQGNNLITSHDTYHYYQQAQKQLAQHQQEAIEEKKQQEQKAAAKANSPIQEVLERGNAFITQIHRCNDAIPGEEISAKITHMEMIVEKIFSRAEAHPEIVPDLKKLMDYYLPMTVKLLNAYAEMDAQPIQGDTIVASKREIEDTLDTLNDAFEKLLDSVFKDTAMDISSDISVLQTLLAQEGLTDDDLTKMKKDPGSLM